jgi:hypothetical protein
MIAGIQPLAILFHAFVGLTLLPRLAELSRHFAFR